MENETPKNKSMTPFFVGLGFTLFILGIAGLLYYNMQLMKTIEKQNALLEQQEKQEAQQEPEKTQKPTLIPGLASDAFGSYKIIKDAEGNNFKDYTPGFEKQPIQIKWNKGAAPLSEEATLSLLRKVDPAFNFNTSFCPTPESTKCRVFVYEAGKITGPQYLEGKTLYLFGIPSTSLGEYYESPFAFFDENTKHFVLLQTELEGIPVQKSKLLFQGTLHTDFSSLQAPNEFSLPGTDSVISFIRYEARNDDPFDGTAAVNNRGGILNIEKEEKVNYARYTEKNLVFTDPQYGPVYFYDKAYHLILPDGSVRKYELVPSFLSSAAPEGSEKFMFNGILTVKIQWTDGRKENLATKYSIGGDISTSGCSAGIAPCTNVVNNNPWFNEKNLVQVGKTNTNESVYELKDALTNSYYKELFDYGYAASKLYPSEGEGKAITQEQLDAMSPQAKMAEFVADHPLFFWKDQAGNWRVYQKSKYRSLVECGKPVIYLYPTTETLAHVEVSPLGGLTKTEPSYGTKGWTVKAKPDGTLTNADGKMYPYLFWEGIGYNYQKPTQGFMLKKENVDSEMKTILAKLGLNEKESKDFLEFWSEKLKVKPYVFVTFVSQSEFDKIAPLTVSPKPKTVIRVFMDYTPMEKPLTVSPLRIQTPERKGFTVVEWGGALHK